VDDPFDSLVLSWEPRGDAALDLAARVRVRGRWSRWYALACWRQDDTRASVPGQADALGRVDVDTLTLVRPANAFQWRALVRAGPRSGALRAVHLVVADLAQPPGVSERCDWVGELDVPVRSQMVEAPAIRHDICSPTCLAMLLERYGIDLPTARVARTVRDAAAGIYGNWPFNTAFAASLGLSARVERLWSLHHVRARLAAGRPQVLSLRWQAGELEGAPIPHSRGHLLVVRGMTAEGGVIVNDPAAPDPASVRRIYRADQLERLWLAAGGVVYDLWAEPAAP
jgi:hypothetical protein